MGICPDEDIREIKFNQNTDYFKIIFKKRRTF